MYIKKATGFVTALSDRENSNISLKSKGLLLPKSIITKTTKSEDLYVILRLLRIKNILSALALKLAYCFDSKNENNNAVAKAFNSNNELNAYIKSEIEAAASQAAEEFYEAAATNYYNKYFGTIYKAQAYKKQMKLPELPPIESYNKILEKKDNINVNLKERLINTVSSLANKKMSYSEIKMLIETEAQKEFSYIEDEIHRSEINGAIDALKAEKIDYYQVICSDVHTACDTCAGLHQKPIKLADAKEGINLPLLHPNCRCTIGSYIELEDNRNLWEKICDWFAKTSDTISDYIQLAEIRDSFPFIKLYMKRIKSFFNQFCSIKSNDNIYFYNSDNLQNIVIANDNLIDSENANDIDKKLLELMKMRDSGNFSDKYNDIVLEAYKLMMQHQPINNVPQFSVDFFKPYSYYQVGRDTTDEIMKIMKEYEEKYKDEKGNYILFYNLVKNGGELDLKNRANYKTNSAFVFDGEIVDNDALGNITYGYFGKVLNIPEAILFGMGGYAQRLADTSKLEFWDTFDDDPRDQYRILQGIQLYEKLHAKK